MRKILKIAVWLTAVLVAGTAIVIAWYASASQPRINGRLVLRGLHAHADIVRDAEGVPHIYAESAEDAYFALGFVHAQDRLWQMELNRRIAAGRTAEILGAAGLDTDRFLRTLGVRRNAEAIVANLSAEARRALAAYAAGVNAYLAQRRGPLPPEFILTGAPAPEPWTATDSISWQTMMAWDLGGNWSQELLRMRLSQRLPLARINELLAPYPGETALVTRDYTQLYRELAGTTQQLERVAAIAPPVRVDGMGSNSWVVSGALSETGKPLMANDPHLGLTVPSLWYLAHISAPGLNVIGATMPGLPGFVLGHNDRIAWAFTNTGTDTQDLFIERIDPANPDRYQTPGGWQAFDKRTEIIKVKGGGEVRLEVRRTRHGPVITGALPILSKAPLDARRYAIAFCWAALRPDDLTFEAALGMNRSRDWRGFVDAARDFSTPQQNISYADVDGNIGFIAPGRVPVRKPENDLKGLAPAPGWDARYDWNGFVPFDRLPLRFNPPSQRIVTANQKIVADDYPYFLTSEWSLPYRADRIEALLDLHARHSLDDFSAIQADIVSPAARELLPVALRTKPRSAKAKEALGLLAAWKGEMAADRPEPLVFNAWMREASREIFEDELGKELMSDYWDQRNVHRAMVNALLGVDRQSEWCGNAMLGKNASCSDLLAASLDVALADLEKRYGPQMSSWKWGAAHQAHSAHRPFSHIALLAWLFDIRLPSGGDTYSIEVGRYTLRNEEAPFENTHGPGLRMLYDLSDWEKSRFIQATGQSGNLFSPLYRNFAERWAQGRTIPMTTRRRDVEKGALGTLSLIPG